MPLPQFMITSTPLDTTQVVLAMITSLPAFVAAVAAAAISWHNRVIARDTQSTAKETKTMVNGRMDQLLEAAKALAEARGRAQANAANTEANTQAVAVVQAKADAANSRSNSQSQ